MINTKTAPYAALLLRVSMGILFLAHAVVKVFVFTIPGTVGFFSSIGLPGWLAYAVIALEIVGGVALILGYRVALFAIPLAVDLLGAIVTVHGANGWAFSDKGGGWEYPAFWAVALIALALLGNGAWSIQAEPVPEQRLQY